MSLKSINPASGQVVAEYDEHDDAIVDAALDRANETFAEYRRTGFDERARLMRRAAGILRERTDRYGRLMTMEMGKPLDAARAEVEKCALVCDYYAENASTFLADDVIETDAERSYISYQPIGAVLAIMPWNFPFWQCFRFAAPALMAGNVGLLKHASNVPGSALAIEQVFRDAGFPEGAFTTLMIGSSAVGRLIADKRIAAVTLTGSEEAGRKVGEQAGGALKKIVLELGGSDPFIVMPSADLQKAVEGAVKARTLNNGQSCIAAKRFIIHESIADEFEKRMAEAFRQLQVGDPADESVDMGPLARPEFVDDLERQVKESIEKGARLVVGGERGNGGGYFYEPTILADVVSGMPAYDEETFGPVAALITVKDLAGAIAVANDTRFGLGASAWTEDETEIADLVREIESGSVFINGIVKSDPRLPFGGVKASGIGRELGEAGIREFVNVKSIWIGTR